MWHEPRSSSPGHCRLRAVRRVRPHGSTGSLVFGAPQAQRRRLRVAGPLDNERGRLAALLHIVWLLRMPAGAHVLAAEAFRTCMSALTSLAERTETQQLFTDAAARKAGVADLKLAIAMTPSSVRRDSCDNRRLPTRDRAARLLVCSLGCPGTVRHCPALRGTKS